MSTRSDRLVHVSPPPEHEYVGVFAPDAARPSDAIHATNTDPDGGVNEADVTDPASDAFVAVAGVEASRVGNAAS